MNNPFMSMDLHPPPHFYHRFYLYQQIKGRCVGKGQLQGDLFGSSHQEIRYIWCEGQKSDKRRTRKDQGKQIN